MNESMPVMRRKAMPRNRRIRAKVKCFPLIEIMCQMSTAICMNRINLSSPYQQWSNEIHAIITDRSLRNAQQQQQHSIPSVAPISQFQIQLQIFRRSLKSIQEIVKLNGIKYHGMAAAHTHSRCSHAATTAFCFHSLTVAHWLRLSPAFEWKMALKVESLLLSVLLQA